MRGQRGDLAAPPYHHTSLPDGRSIEGRGVTSPKQGGACPITGERETMTSWARRGAPRPTDEPTARRSVTSFMRGEISSLPREEKEKREQCGRLKSDHPSMNNNLLMHYKPTPRKPVGLPVKVDIDGCIFVALIDTGATVSIIEEGKLGSHHNLKGRSIALNTTAGPTVTEGVADVCFKIKDMRFTYECHVVNSLNIPGISFILGIDFISSQDVTVYGGRVGRPCVFISDLEIPVLDIQVQSTAASLTTSVVGYTGGEERVPAATLQFIYVSPSQPLPEGSLVIIEPFERVSENILNGVMEVRDGVIAVPCVNLTPEVLRIEGNSLCHIWPCDVMSDVTNQLHLCGAALGERNHRNIDDSREQELRNQRVLEIAREAAPPNFNYVITDIIAKYLDVVTIGNEKPGQIQHHHFRIDTGNHPPIQSRPYRIPVSAQQSVAEEICKLKEHGIIRESESAWSSPVVLVKKKNGSNRLCIDFRRLNAITRDDRYPLPSVEELLVKVRGSQYFSTLDLKSGYHQIPVYPEDRAKTAFIANDALHEYNFLPFGVKNAPGHFSRVMMSVLVGLIGEAVLVYLDDLIILGKDAKEHTGNLVKVLEALKRHGLKLNIEKCKFFQKQVVFLGHLVTSEGISPCIDKVGAIKNFPVPRNPKEVASFFRACRLLP